MVENHCKLGHFCYFVNELNERNNRKRKQVMGKELKICLNIFPLNEPPQIFGHQFLRLNVIFFPSRIRLRIIISSTTTKVKHENH